MGCDNDSLAVLNIGFETLEPVGARAFETLEVQDSGARKKPTGKFVGFERAVEFPSSVDRIKIVRRDEDRETLRLSGLEDHLHVRDGIVFPQALVDQGPRQPPVTQDLILRVDKDYRGVVLVDVHSFPRFDPGTLSAD
jgi:hypothetical protein